MWNKQQNHSTVRNVPINGTLARPVAMVSPGDSVSRLSTPPPPSGWVFPVFAPLTAAHPVVGPLSDPLDVPDFIEWNRQNFRWIREKILVVFGS